jgi:hypothetical protein
MARHGSLKAFLPFRRRRDALKIDVSHVAIQSRGISSWGPTKQRAKREATNRARVTSAGSVPQHEHGRPRVLRAPARARQSSRTHE